MKICLAQTQPVTGNIPENIKSHLYFVQQAIENGADLIAFSELSLTGYEPELAETLAMDLNDQRLDVFQKVSDQNKISILVGVPLRSENGITINMIIYQPNQLRQVYSKKYLHPDETPFFVSGTNTIDYIGTDPKIGLAICYEISVTEHENQLMKENPDIYLASVAKFVAGIGPAQNRLTKLSKNYGVLALMVNAVGPADDGICTGQSAVWDENGKMTDCLDSDKQGILILDTKTRNVFRQDID